MAVAGCQASNVCRIVSDRSKTTRSYDYIYIYIHICKMHTHKHAHTIRRTHILRFHSFLVDSKFLTICLVVS